MFGSRKSAGPRQGQLLRHRFCGIAEHQSRIALPNGTTIGPPLAVETKDEHDGVSARDFGKMLVADTERMGPSGVIVRGAKGIKFTMLKEEHFDVAREFFETEDFDRLFIVHGLDTEVRETICRGLAEQHRIHWLTIPEMVQDLYCWYENASRAERIAMRNVLTGDLFHLLVGYCRFHPG